MLNYADQLNVGGAYELNRDYGVYLLLVVAVLGVFAIFKTSARVTIRLHTRLHLR